MYMYNHALLILLVIYPHLHQLLFRITTTVSMQLKAAHTAHAYEHTRHPCYYLMHVCDFIQMLLRGRVYFVSAVIIFPCVGDAMVKGNPEDRFNSKFHISHLPIQFSSIIVIILSKTQHMSPE